MPEPASTIDIGSLSTPFAPFSAMQAARIAHRLYGLDGKLTRLATEKDDTYRIDAASGPFVLKIANPGESREELDLQVKTLEHVAETAPDLPVPRVLRSLEGRQLVTLQTADGPRIVRAMTFLPGQLLDSRPPRRDEQVEIGRVAARLRLSLAGFEHPAADRILAWDVRHLPGLRPLLAHVGEATHRQALTEAFERFAALKPRIDRLPRQVLHNDFNRSNLLLASSGPARVTGIIDFGDVVRTAVAIDLSTAMLNQLPREDEPAGDMFAGPRAVLEGYLSEAPLTAEELALVPHLVMGRIVTRALLSLWRAEQFPQNSRYILRNTAQGWAQLDWFLARTPAELSALLP